MSLNLKQSVLITGASGGIGLELARLFAKDGHRLVLVARSGERLDKIAREFASEYKVDVTYLVSDLAQSNAAQRLFEELQNRNIRIDILVNNAGFGTYGLFHETDWTQTAEMLQLNMVTLTQLTRLLLPSMISRKSGKILNVASTAGFFPGPLMAAYYASKAYVVSLSEALANEMAGTGVSVTVLCPGPTRTEFQNRAKVDKSRLFKKMKVMSAAEVAAVGYRALWQQKTLAIAGLMNAAGVQLTRISPRKFTAAVVRKIQETA